MFFAEALSKIRGRLLYLMTSLMASILGFADCPQIPFACLSDLLTYSSKHPISGKKGEMDGILHQTLNTKFIKVSKDLKNIYDFFPTLEMEL